MIFRWLAHDDRREELFVGCASLPAATIVRLGERWSAIVNIPSDNVKWRTYLKKEVLQETVESEVRRFIEFAVMDLPAMDKENVDD